MHERLIIKQILGQLLGKEAENKLFIKSHELKI